MATCSIILPGKVHGQRSLVGYFAPLFQPLKSSLVMFLKSHSLNRGKLVRSCFQVNGRQGCVFEHPASLVIELE